MDCRDVGAFANAAKRPLGLVYDILLAQYSEDTAAVRRAEALRIDEWATAMRVWLHRQRPRTPLENYWYWGQKALTMRDERLAIPGGRCAHANGRGWCRRRSHRSVSYTHLTLPTIYSV